MESVRPFLPRREPRMGEVVVEVQVTNGRDLTRTKRFEALVDTGAYGLVLPLAWKDELGELEAVATVGRDRRSALDRGRRLGAGLDPDRRVQANQQRGDLRRDGAATKRLPTAPRLLRARAVERGRRPGVPPTGVAEALPLQIRRLRLTAVAPAEYGRPKEDSRPCSSASSTSTSSPGPGRRTARRGSSARRSRRWSWPTASAST